MGECMIPLSWAHLDRMEESIDILLGTWDTPTILRLRAQMVLEELFSALMERQEGGKGWLRCSCPAPRTLLLQYRTGPGAQEPDLAGLAALSRESCTYGLKVELGRGACTLLVGQR